MLRALNPVPLLAGKNGWTIGMILLLCLQIGSTAALDAKTIRDIAYKSGQLTEYEQEACKLNLYLPEGAENFPVLVYFHGGNLVFGDKDSIFAWGIAEKFLDAGVAIASANYRMNPRAHYPAYAKDAAAAVAWVSKNISKYGGNPNKVFVGGHSAGGTLAAIVGTNGKFYDEVGLDENKIAGYVPISAQTATHWTIRAERGRDEYYVDDAAPQFHARAMRQPFLCFSAEHDFEGRSAESDSLVARLSQAYKNSSHTVVRERNHTTIFRNMANEQDEVRAAILAMMEKYSAPLKTETLEGDACPKHAIIPQPLEFELTGGSYTLKPECRIVADPLFASEANLLAGYLRPATVFPFQVDLETNPREPGGGDIYLQKASPGEIAEESYELAVDTDKIVIRASAPAGVFYGSQTLRQLLPVEIFAGSSVEEPDWTIDCVKIKDQPRFAWRAYLLDEARHFQGMETVKRQLEQIALHKMNVFQWHLVDDQGWRIEIKKYPKLTELSSWRKETQIEYWRSPKRSGVPHGGFYTQEQIKEIVDFAARRHITIVPEIEMPGHASAAIHAYPEVGTTGRQIDIPVYFGVMYNIYNVADENTITFLQDVLTEVMALFPSKVVHIGGDEVRYDHWKASLQVQELMKREGLASFAEVQLYFTNRMSHFLDGKGRRMMGWNEILGGNIHEYQKTEAGKKGGNGSLAQNSIVHFWAGDPAIAERAVRQGYDIVNSYHRYTYLDYDYQALPMERGYSFDPIPEGLPEQYHSQVLGLGCQMWGEWTPNRKRVEYQTFPRVSAFAEVGWSSWADKDYQDFLKRLHIQMKRWDLQGVHYADVFDR